MLTMLEHLDMDMRILGGRTRGVLIFTTVVRARKDFSKPEARITKL